MIDQCSICGAKHWLQWHHKFKQSKTNKKLYPDFIHHVDNLQRVCAGCHLQKVKGLIIWNEVDFCQHFKLHPRGKAWAMNKSQSIMR